MIAVSDMSPLLNLCRVGAFSLLGQIYGEVIAPPEVREEPIRNGVEPSDLGGLVIQSPIHRKSLDELLVELDPGEAASIILAIEVSADVVLLDERRGRRMAAAMGLRVVGLLGILAGAKAMAQYRGYPNRASGEPGFRLSADLGDPVGCRGFAGQSHYDAVGLNRLGTSCAL